MKSNRSISHLVPATLSSLNAAPSADHLDIGLVGDVYMRDEFLAQFGYPHPINLREKIWQPLLGSSLIIANLEAPITKEDAPVEKKPYLHKTSPAVLEIFDQRFVLSIANNHIMDYGPTGLFDTMAALDNAGISYAGAGVNIDQAKTPRWLTIKGVQIAVICAADSRFSPATTTSPGTCPAYPELLVEIVDSVKARADLIVVSLHMGLEYVSVPSATQINLAEVCLKSGAHVVHYHHAHCLSGAATDGRGVVLFGTGNYIFTKIPKVKVPASRRSAVWRARVNIDTKEVVGLTVKPVVLDHAGLPCLLEKAAADHELKYLQECSKYMLGGLRRHLARLKDVLNPAFLWFNAYNYGFLLRRRGLLYVLKSLGSGIKAQFGKQFKD